MDEKLKVLKLLEEGKINAEEAERLLHALSKVEKSNKVFTMNIDEFLKGLEKLYINVNAGSFEIRKGEKSYIEKIGIVQKRKDGKEGYIDVNGGTCELVIKDDIPMEVGINFGHCEVETGADFKGRVRLGNLEVLIIKPINIEIENSFGNIEVIYLCEPDARFEIENNFGSVNNDFKENEGSKTVKIKNSFGEVSINKKTGG